MKINGQLKWTDYLNSQLLHLRPTTFMRVVYYSMYAVVLLAFGGIIYQFVTGQLEFSFSYLLPFLFIIAIVPLYRYVFLPMQTRKIFAQQKALNSPFEIEFDETEMTVSNEFGNHRMPWGNFAKWKEDSELLMLYHSDVMYNIIPKRFFSDPQQIEIIRSFLEKNKVSKSKNRSALGCIIYIILCIVIGVVLYINFKQAVAP
jgi:hypothetical protein